MVADHAGSWWTRERKTAAVIAGANAAVLAYGFAFWDYGSSSGFETKDEDWFGDDTDHGGADKAGHAYTAATLTNVSANLFRRWGHDRETAAGLGAVLGLSVTALMEVGDGISDDFGYSHEDMVANVVGTGFGYLRARYPALARHVDFRAEYWPSHAVTSGESADIVTDYEGLRYLLAFKGSGWVARRDHPLRHRRRHGLPVDGAPVPLRPAALSRAPPRLFHPGLRRRCRQRRRVRPLRLRWHRGQPDPALASLARRRGRYRVHLLSGPGGLTATPTQRRPGRGRVRLGAVRIANRRLGAVRIANRRESRTSRRST